MPGVSIPQAKVQGTFTSGSFVVTGTNPGDVLRIMGDIKASDLTKPEGQLTLNLRMYLFDVANGIWRFAGGGGWKSSPSNTGQPIVEISLPPNGTTIRGELDVPVQMTVGATIETGPSAIPPE